ncbi:MAG: hypothetical protein ACFBZ8_08965 [Opitutales bacterium]
MNNLTHRVGNPKTLAALKLLVVSSLLVTAAAAAQANPYHKEIRGGGPYGKGKVVHREVVTERIHYPRHRANHWRPYGYGQRYHAWQQRRFHRQHYNCGCAQTRRAHVQRRVYGPGNICAAPLPPRGKVGGRVVYNNGDTRVVVGVTKRTFPRY